MSAKLIMKKLALANGSIVIPYKNRRAYGVARFRGAYHVMRAKLRKGLGWVPASDVGEFDTEAEALSVARSKARHHNAIAGKRAGRKSK